MKNFKITLKHIGAMFCCNAVFKSYDVICLEL